MGKIAFLKARLQPPAVTFGKRSLPINVYTCHLHVKTKYVIDTENSPQKKEATHIYDWPSFLPKSHKPYSWPIMTTIATTCNCGLRATNWQQALFDRLYNSYFHSAHQLTFKKSIASLSVKIGRIVWFRPQNWAFFSLYYKKCQSLLATNQLLGHGAWTHFATS